MDNLILNDPRNYRHTKGALNVIGSIANMLFGIATQSQIDLIHNRSHSLDSFMEQERKIFNVHSSILKVTLRDLINAHHALDKLETASKISEKIQETEKGLNMLKTLMHVQLALSIMSADHMNFKMSLQIMTQTYVSPLIDTNSRLLTLLDDILVKTLGLLFPPKLEFLGFHRAAIRDYCPTCTKLLFTYSS